MRKKEIHEIKRQRDSLTDMMRWKEQDLAVCKARASELERCLSAIVQAAEKRDCRALEDAVNKAKGWLLGVTPRLQGGGGGSSDAGLDPADPTYTGEIKTGRDSGKCRFTTLPETRKRDPGRRQVDLKIYRNRKEEIIVTGRIFEENTLVLRQSAGEALGEDGLRYELSIDLANGQPVIRSLQTGKSWTITWEELILLARSAGIDQ